MWASWGEVLRITDDFSTGAMRATAEETMKSYDLDAVLDGVTHASVIG